MSPKAVIETSSYVWHLFLWQNSKTSCFLVALRNQWNWWIRKGRKVPISTHTHSWSTRLPRTGWRWVPWGQELVADLCPSHFGLDKWVLSKCHLFQFWILINLLTTLETPVYFILLTKYYLSFLSPWDNSFGQGAPIGVTNTMSGPHLRCHLMSKFQPLAYLWLSSTKFTSARISNFPFNCRNRKAIYLGFL